MTALDQQTGGETGAGSAAGQAGEQALANLLAASPRSMEQLLELITPDIHQKLRAAVELGKWADGSRLAPAQLERCLQVLILYEARHLPEQDRIAALAPGAGCPAGAGTQVRQQGSTAGVPPPGESQ